MLLSRVAESVYWTGRYLERVETTARILQVHTELFLDLPKSAGVGWAPLLAITGASTRFADRHDEIDEERVVAFLVYDNANPGSVMASIGAARENLRVTRSIFPREVWEVLNHLYFTSGDNSADVRSRRQRLHWVDDVIAHCQRLTGALAGTMSHDPAYAFLRLGSHLERADMTTRVLDVRAGMPDDGPATQEQPYSDLLWMSVLRSVAAQQMYRRTVQSRVWGADVLRFLLRDPLFPRSVAHCLDEMTTCLQQLPHPEQVLAELAEVSHQIGAARGSSLSWGGLHDFADEVQGLLGGVHERLDESYFRSVPGSRRPALATA